MNDTPGTTALTPAQTDDLERLTGFRYSHVQDGTHGQIVFETVTGPIPNNRRNRRRFNLSRRTP